MLWSAVLAITHFKGDMPIFTYCDEKEHITSVKIQKETSPFFENKNQSTLIQKVVWFSEA